MARKRNPVTEEAFFASLNNQSDLRAITHGHQRLVDIVDEAVEKLLMERGIGSTRSDALQRLGIDGQVDVLVLCDRLDADLRPIVGHLTAVRNRMVHGYGHEFTKDEGAIAWGLLPKRAKERAPLGLDRSRPGQVIRWSIVTTYIRVVNRAIHLHEASLPV
jgi:hypothetical protein